MLKCVRCTKSTLLKGLQGWYDMTLAGKLCLRSCRRVKRNGDGHGKRDSVGGEEKSGRRVDGQVQLIKTWQIVLVILLPRYSQLSRWKDCKEIMRWILTGPLSSRFSILTPTGVLFSSRITKSESESESSMGIITRLGSSGASDLILFVEVV